MQGLIEKRAEEVLANVDYRYCQGRAMIESVSLAGRGQRQITYPFFALEFSFRK